MPPPAGPASPVPDEQLGTSVTTTTPTAPHLDTTRRSYLHNPTIAFVLLLIVALVARAVTLNNPALGFDEQFYLMVGDQMLHGKLPFVDIFDRKPIGIFLIYAGARLLGGEGFVQYKLVALAFVVATAFLLYRTARWRTGAVGAFVAATLYILWLDFMEGEGGQTPVFYNLFMLGAGALLLDAVRRSGGLWWRGLGAMALTGIAIQIKYAAVFEGVFFGCAFLLLAYKRGMPWLRHAGFAAAMIVLALVPTLLAMGYYWSIGHLDEFLFCNFVSVFGQQKSSLAVGLLALLRMSPSLIPLVIVGWVGRHDRSDDAGTAAPRYLLGWLLTAIAAVVFYWRFNSPHYAMPILPPAFLMLAPIFERRRRLAIGFTALAFVSGQIVEAVMVRNKGGGREMRAIAAAARTNGHYIFVYDGYPGLYMMTHSAMPSRWAFPGHVNAADEANALALGGDPVTIVRQILAGNPDAIVQTHPRFGFGNPDTLAVMEQVIEHGATSRSPASTRRAAGCGWCSAGART